MTLPRRHLPKKPRRRADTGAMSRDRVIVARIGAAHGLGGEVRLKSFTETAGDVAAYGPLAAPDGRLFEITSVRAAPGKATDMLITRFKGVDGREAAEDLNGTDLSVSRAALPAPSDEEFYHADLIGLSVVTPSGAALGTVASVVNYGAGDLIEIAPAHGAAFLVPFTRAAVPEIEISSGKLVIDPPLGTLPESDEP